MPRRRATSAVLISSIMLPLYNKKMSIASILHRIAEAAIEHLVPLRGLLGVRGVFLHGSDISQPIDSVIVSLWVWRKPRKPPYPPRLASGSSDGLEATGDVHMC